MKGGITGGSPDSPLFISHQAPSTVKSQNLQRCRSGSNDTFPQDSHSLRPASKRHRSSFSSLCVRSQKGTATSQWIEHIILPRFWSESGFLSKSLRFTRTNLPLVHG